MRCPACGSNNPDVARFCSACGARFEAAKPKESEAVLATGSGPRTEAPVKGKGLSVASLVLGVLSIFPFSFLTGIPAIITGAIALAQRRLGRGMAIAGVVLGAIGSAVIGAGIILALIIPNFVLFQDRARRASVKNNMHVFQTALEAYATDHNGNYPGSDADWSDPEDIFYAYFPGGDPIGAEGSPIFGQVPLNPYTGERYEYGKDLFYFPARLTESGVNSIIEADQAGCPYDGLEAPGGVQGTIVILGYTPEDAPLPAPQEYAVIGYGRDVSSPTSDNDPSYGKVYFALHN